VLLPDGALATWSSDHVLRSIDDGARWQRVGQATPYTPTALAFNWVSGAFYIARFDCSNDQSPIASNSFMRLDGGG
jgi:hypothetical protein